MSTEPLATDLSPAAPEDAAGRGLIIAMLLLVVLGVTAMMFMG